MAMGEEGQTRQSKGTPGGQEIAEPATEREPVHVLVELRLEAGTNLSAGLAQAHTIDVPGFELDASFEPVGMGGGPSIDGGGPTPETFIVRGAVLDDEVTEALKALPGVVGVWIDAPHGPERPEPT